MKRKFVLATLSVALLVTVFAGGVIASNKITLIVNGKVASADPVLINGVTYVPLRAAAELLGAQVSWEADSRTVYVGEKGASINAPTGVHSDTINGITVTMDDVKQDSDSLRLYVTYINNTNDAISTGDSLTKVVANGKQYEYESDFNFDRYYNKDVDKAPAFIEPGVTAKSVIFFEPIPDVDKINIVLNAKFEKFRFNDVTVGK